MLYATDRDMSDTEYVSGIWQYLALFEVSGIQPGSTSLSGRIPNIFNSGKLLKVDSIKIKFTFSINVKKFNASLKTLILFGLSTKSRTESKP